MGVVESKLLANNLLSACSKAEREGKSQLDESQFWEDAQGTIKASKSIYKHIPQRIRRTPRQSAIKKAIVSSSQQIQAPQLVQDLQDERVSLFPSYLPTTSAHVIRDSGCDDSLSDIECRVRRWVGLGERYSLLAHDLGGLGALYLLPDDGGESIWTKELPKTATKPGRIAMLNHLRQKRLPEEAERRGLHALAESEAAKVLGPIKASLDRSTTEWGCLYLATTGNPSTSSAQQRVPIISVWHSSYTDCSRRGITTHRHV
ncbi:hypothetical protein N7526_001986 [Penicillium atrosanguineum]|nr:hypothetical protein N7526_001986 [Penicillium atrosanguineum]